MTKLENLRPNAEGYMVDEDGRKVVFYVCDPTKNILCTHGMCRAMTAGEGEAEIGFCASTPEKAFQKEGTKPFYKRLNADGYYGREYIGEEAEPHDD